jgi:hypothetical protein
MRIAFDIHGTLDRDRLGILRKLVGSLLNTNNIIYIISGSPTENIKAMVGLMGIDPKDVIAISVVDYLKSKNVPMHMKGGTWWCDDDIWWKSKGMICAEHEIDVIFDDKIEYKEHMPITTKFILWEGDIL